MGGLFDAPLFAISFLTVVPTALSRAPSPDTYGRSLWYFPIVGALLGMVAALFDAALASVLPIVVVTVLVLALLALLSGGLHLDGLADAVDGLFAGGSRAERLAIMRDSRAGAFGAAAVALVLLLEVAALGAIPVAARATALIVAASMSRWSMCVTLWSSPSARSDGLGAAFRSGLRGRDATIATGVALVIAAGLGTGALVALALAGLISVALSAVARSRLGGVTGDVCGAIGEIAFAGQLVLFSAGTS